MFRYLNDVARISALGIGTIAGGIMTGILYGLGVSRPWAWGLIAGAATALFFAILIALLSRKHIMKIFNARSRVVGDVLAFLVVGVRCPEFVRRGYIFLTAESIHLFLWEKRPYLESVIKREEITVYQEIDTKSRFTLCFSDNDHLEIITPYAAELVRTMRENKFQVSDSDRTECE